MEQFTSMKQITKKVKTHSSELRGQRGSSKQCPDELEAHMHEYFTGTRVVKIENAVTKEP